MTRASFIKAFQSFSRVLGPVPQDDLPSDLAGEVASELHSMRQDPGRFMFGLHEGEQTLPYISNIAFGISTVLQNRWNHANKKKALWIDIHQTEIHPTRNLNKAFDYEHERERFVAAHMAKLLVDIKRDIPDELRSYLGIRRSGSKEQS